MGKNTIQPILLFLNLILPWILFAKNDQPLDFSFWPGLMTGLLSVAIIVSLVAFWNKRQNQSRGVQPLLILQGKEIIYLAIGMLTTLTGFVLIKHFKEYSAIVFVLIPIILASVISNGIFIRKVSRKQKGRPIC